MQNTMQLEGKTGLIGGPEKRAIEIVPYRAGWPHQFQLHAGRIAGVLNATVRRIEHIGSTSVEGLASKPIIDMLVVVPDAAKEHLYLSQLLSAGYELRVREPDFEEHRMFRAPARDVHIHVFSEGAGEIERYILFRDFIRENGEFCRRYEMLKYGLARTEWADMNDYARAKSEFVEDVIQRARSAKCT